MAMMVTNPGRPAAAEHIRYYDQYIGLVPEGDIVALLEGQIAETVALLDRYTLEEAQARPAPGEWSAIEIVGHLADTERIIAYRALRIARNDAPPLEGMDPEALMAGAGFAERPLADVVAEFVTVRRATVTLLRGLDATAWMRSGLTDGDRITTRALAYLIAGHERHHARDLQRSDTSV